MTITDLLDTCSFKFTTCVYDALVDATEHAALFRFGDQEVWVPHDQLKHRTVYWGESGGEITVPKDIAIAIKTHTRAERAGNDPGYQHP